MAIDIRSFSAADVPLGMHLKGQAGWNQTAADWHRLLALQPDGCFLAELNGRPVGTTAATIFGSVGWLSLVLVDREARGCGVATALVRHALAWLDSRSVPTVRLDATELGEPIYARLGFTADYGLARWAGSAKCFALEDWVYLAPTAATQRLNAANLAAACELDRHATGADRRKLLEQLYAERPGAMQFVTEPEGLTGFGWLRAGSERAHIGPVVARSESVGRSMLDSLLNFAEGNPVVVDIPADNLAANAWAASCELTIERRLTRMTRGARCDERPHYIWAGFGPEKG